MKIKKPRRFTKVHERDSKVSFFPSCAFVSLVVDAFSFDLISGQGRQASRRLLFVFIFSVTLCLCGEQKKPAEFALQRAFGTLCLLPRSAPHTRLRVMRVMMVVVMALDDHE